MKNLPPECGRELRPDELATDTIVVVGVADRDIYATLWVRRISPTMVEFFAGEIDTSLCVSRAADGALRDDQGKQIHVYEWNREACV